jgi:hypothetical protein
MFANQLELFSIGTISLPLETLETMVANIIQIKRTTKTTYCKGKPFYNLKSSTKNVLNKKPKFSLEDKVYLETYYHHTSGQI